MLWPYDVNYPVPSGGEGGQLNRFINLPVEWQQQSSSGLDRMKVEALAFGSTQRNLNLALEAIQLFPGLGWPLSSLTYLVPVFGSATPWASELALVWGAGIPVANLWALDHVCLYAGHLPHELALVAPYLVRLDREAPFTADLLRDGWGESWGIFLIATTGLEEMRRHLRKLLRVEDERGKKLVFRYYDPRVLRAYLPTCTPGELRLLFGPAGVFFAEGEDPAELLRFHRAVDGTLERTVVPLSAPPG